MFVELKTAWLMLRRRKVQSSLIGVIVMLMTILLYIGLAIIGQPDSTGLMFERGNATDSLILLDNNASLDMKESVEWWLAQDEVEGTIIYDVHMANLEYENNGKIETELSFITPFVNDSDYDLMYKTENIRSIAPKGNELLMNYNFAKSRNIAIGDTWSYNHEGESIDFIVKDFLVDPQFSTPFLSPNRFFVRENFFEEMNIDFSNKLLGIKYKDGEVNDTKLFENYKKEVGIQGMFIDQETIVGSYEIITVVVASILITVALFIFAIVVFVIRSLIKNMIVQQYKQIGVKKVIGYTNKQIRNSMIYMYTSLSIVASLIGVIIALPIRQTINKSLSSDIQVGIETGMDSMMILSILMVVGATLLFTFLATRQANKIKPVQAIKYGMAENKMRQHRFSISKTPKIPLSLLLALKQLIVNRRKTMTTLLLMTLLIYAAFIIQNAGYSLADEEHFLLNLFSLEIGDATVSNTTDQDINGFIETLESIDAVDEVVFYQYVIGGSSQGVDGLEKIAIGGVLIYGDFPEQGLKTFEGRQPVNDHEIALSYLAAEATGKRVGDYMTIQSNDGEQRYLVSGLFNTISFSGVAYCKIMNEVTLDIQPGSGGYWLYSSDENVIIEDIEAEILKIVQDEVSISRYDALTKDVLGTMAPFPTMVKSLLTIFLIISSIIVLNFAMMDMNESTRTFGVLKAVGYSNKSITDILLIKALLITGVAVILGFVLNLLTANLIMGSILSSTPFSSIEFTILMDYVGCALIILLFILVTIIATLIPARRIRMISPKILISE